MPGDVAATSLRGETAHEIAGGALVAIDDDAGKTGTHLGDRLVTGGHHQIAADHPAAIRAA